MARHPDTDLVPYLRGELPPAERERVARHLEECPDCKQDTELLRDLLGNLAHAIGQPPAVSWARYRAELREKLERRRAPAWAGWTWRLRPVQVAVAAGFVAVLVYIGLPGYGAMPTDPVLMENAVLASRLDMIDHLDVVQKLDILEDFDVIRKLDTLPSRGEG